MFGKIKEMFTNKTENSEESNEGKIVVEGELGSNVEDNIKGIKENLEEDETVVLNHNGVKLEITSDSDTDELLEEYKNALGESNLGNYKDEYGDKEGEEEYNKDSGKA